MSYYLTTPIHEELSAQSILEYKFLRNILARAALPEIADFTVPQFTVSIGEKKYRIDYGIVGAKYKFAIELDGYQFHSQRESFNNDRFRGNDLISDGWTLIRFSTENVNSDPKRCIKQLQETFAKDPLLKFYLLDEIIIEPISFYDKDWEVISQQKKNITNKTSALARSNRNSADMRIKEEGNRFLENRKVAYIAALKNTPPEGSNFEYTPPTGGYSNYTPPPSASEQNKKEGVAAGFQKNVKQEDPQKIKVKKVSSKKPLKPILIGVLGTIGILILVFGFVFLIMPGKSTTPDQQVGQPTAAPDRVNPPNTGITLEEFNAQPCRVGQIKGNQSKVYYIPGQTFYSDVKANVSCFNSEAEAQAAGYGKAKT